MTYVRTYNQTNANLTSIFFFEKDNYGTVRQYYYLSRIIGFISSMLLCNEQV